MAKSAARSTNPPPPTAQQEQGVIRHPFVDALLGEWATESNALWGKGRGKATFALGVGGTALLETYETTFEQEGRKVTAHGHGIYKVSEDGKTVTCWWIDSGRARVVEARGPLTDRRFEITSVGPASERFTIEMERTADGFVFRMTEGGRTENTETFRRRA
jgi:hypothetical protein